MGLLPRYAPGTAQGFVAFQDASIKGFYVVEDVARPLRGRHDL
jgi:hypothetical protein